MYLSRISLVNYKNYSEALLDFIPGVNVLLGNNGEGKTNLLDAIHYLSMCKSYFQPADSANIRNGEDFFIIQGNFDVDGISENIYCGLKRNQKKVFKRNQKEYDRLSEHIGLLPVVMIAPTDTQIITEGSEERRKFLDSIIAQYDPVYLDDLIQYNRVLSQRNAYLKLAAVSRSFDAETCAAWDDQLIRLGVRIHRIRSGFIGRLIPMFLNYYESITGGKEQAGIQYDSQLLKSDFKYLLEEHQAKDRALQYTSVGIHKDDLQFTINGLPVKRYASQGQQKSFLVALKLAQFEFIREIKKFKPILLLDDIFDKLDDRRVAYLMKLVSHENFGQIFITDTHPERVREIFERIHVPIRSFLVRNGTISHLEKEEKTLRAE